MRRAAHAPCGRAAAQRGARRCPHAASHAGAPHSAARGVPRAAWQGGLVMPKKRTIRSAPSTQPAGKYAATSGDHSVTNRSSNSCEGSAGRTPAGVGWGSRCEGQSAARRVPVGWPPRRLRRFDRLLPIWLGSAAHCKHQWEDPVALMIEACSALRPHARTCSHQALGEADAAGAIVAEAALLIRAGLQIAVLGTRLFYLSRSASGSAPLRRPVSTRWLCRLWEAPSPLLQHARFHIDTSELSASQCVDLLLLDCR